MREIAAIDRAEYRKLLAEIWQAAEMPVAKGSA
jgi:hypothetical protein